MTAPAKKKPGNKQRLAHQTILVADDDEMIRTLCSRVLQRDGAETILASNGLHALEAYSVNQHRITIVLLDVRMPEMDGIEAFEKIKKLNPSIGVIFISGYNESEKLVAFKNQGKAEFLEKPYTSEDLVQKILELSGTREDNS